MLASEYKKEAERLKVELKVMSAYADKLADGLPEGMLPKDIEIIRAENAKLMQFYESVKTSGDNATNVYMTVQEAIEEYEK